MAILVASNYGRLTKVEGPRGRGDLAPIGFHFNVI